MLVKTIYYFCEDIQNFETAKEKFVYLVEDENYYNKYLNKILENVMTSFRYFF